MAYQHPSKNSGKRVILALDVPFVRAKELIKQLVNLVAYFKIGLRQIHGNKSDELIKIAHDNGAAVFLDGKINDIPNTGSDAAREIALSGVELFNVHTSGGVKMMKKASESSRVAAAELAFQSHLPKDQFGRPLVIGVTLLTSLDYDALAEIGLAPNITGSNPDDIAERKKLFIERLVVNLALGAKKAGLDGVVASPVETGLIRKACGEDFLIVTPGIRNNGSPPDDQKRTLTATEAINAGSNFLVIGRPIYDSPNPVTAVEMFNSEVVTALSV